MQLRLLQLLGNTREWSKCMQFMYANGIRFSKLTRRALRKPNEIVQRKKPSSRRLKHYKRNYYAHSEEVSRTHLKFQKFSRIFSSCFECNPKTIRSPLITMDKLNLCAPMHVPISSFSMAAQHDGCF